MAKIYKYKDFCGLYNIVEHSDGKCAVYHFTNGKSYRIKNYNSLKGARIGLARYCGGMPHRIDSRGRYI